ncbi:MAG: HDOD domain-containing protein [Thermodesulfovibrionales bacterium]|nr:HDOD domain-containing protein [Thermodesulfovibrionales bacterium]
MYTAEGVRLFIKGLKDLPTLPSIFRKVLIIARCDKSCANDLYELICRDQVLAEKVLAVANSAFYGFSGQIKDIQHAIMLMGFDRLKAIALGMTVLNIFPPKGSFNIKNLWIHSYEVAIIAASLSETRYVVSPKESFVCGLLHDIGRMVFYKMDQKSFLQIPTDEKMFDAERANFGCTHSEAGAWFLEDAKLPEEIVYSVRYHHEPLKSVSHQQAIDITALAEGLSRQLSPKVEDDGIWTEDLNVSALKLSVMEEEKKSIVEKLHSLNSEIQRIFYS